MQPQRNRQATEARHEDLIFIGVGMSLKNISGNIASIAVMVHTIYPNSTGQDIVDAFTSGDWIGHAINIGMALFLYRAGKPAK